MQTKNQAFAEKVQGIGGTLIAIKKADTPLGNKTYIFKEMTSALEKPLLEKYNMSKEDITKLVELPIRGKDKR